MLLLMILFGAVLFLRLFWLITDPHHPKKDLKFVLKIRNLFMASFEAITATLLIITTHFFPLPATSFDVFFITTGVVIFIFGFELLIWGKIVMNKNWGPAGENHNFNLQKDLVMEGPFSFFRNPIYLGILLTDLGIFIALRSYLIFLIFIPYLYYKRAIQKEEQVLENHFGKKYLNYKNKVPSFI